MRLDGLLLLLPVGALLTHPDRLRLVVVVVVRPKWVLILRIARQARREGVASEIRRLRRRPHEGHVPVSLADEGHLLKVTLQPTVVLVLTDVGGDHHDDRKAVDDDDRHDIVQSAEVVLDQTRRTKHGMISPENKVRFTVSNDSTLRTRFQEVTDLAL